MSMINGRLIIAVVTSLLDEALIVAIILWGLPKLGILIPLWGILLICAGFVAYSVLFYIMGSRALIKHPVPGFTSHISLEGEALSRIASNGTVKISGELWNARSETGIIETGSRIVVIDQRGLLLIVRKIGPKTY